MRRPLTVALLLLLPAALLVGCTSTPVATPTGTPRVSLEKWISQHDDDTHTDPRLLGRLFLRVDAGTKRAQPDEGVTLTFQTPVGVDHLEFSCFGSGTMEGTVRTTRAGLQLSRPIGTLSCDKGTQRIDLPETQRTDVGSVSFVAFDSSDDSAWQVDVLAPE